MTRQAPRDSRLQDAAGDVRATLVAEGAGTLRRRLPVLWAMPQRITPSDAVVLLRWGCQAGWLLAKVSENDLKGEEVIPPRIHHA